MFNTHNRNDKVKHHALLGSTPAAVLIEVDEKTSVLDNEIKVITKAKLISMSFVECELSLRDKEYIKLRDDEYKKLFEQIKINSIPSNYHTSSLERDMYFQRSNIMKNESHGATTKEDSSLPSDRKRS